MLKIKDDVDLKELKKFGFEFYYESIGPFAVNDYKKHEWIIYRYECIFIDGKTREIGHCDCEEYDYELAVLYDLIKADLVEKVED